MTKYAPKKDYIGNIDAKQLIVSEINLRKRHLELAQEEVQNAIDTNNKELLPLKYSKAKEFNGMILGLTYALRCLLAQEAEASDRSQTSPLMAMS